VRQLFARWWSEEDGVLSFEWTVLTSLLTVGVVSGIASVRDAVIDEMGDVAQAMIALDQSYMIQPPLAVAVHTGGFGTGFGFSGGFGGFGGGFGGVSTASGSQFIDAASFADCFRGHMRVQEFPRPGHTPPGSQPAVPQTQEPAL
jgi:Flp pilus assembly pilin Flp